MAGKRGGPRPNSGGAREGAGRKPAPIPENPYGVHKDPLDFLLEVMNNPLEKRDLRVRAAITASQYMHNKKGDGGKKEGRDDAAQAAIQNNDNIAPRQPPKLVAVK